MVGAGWTDFEPCRDGLIFKDRVFLPRVPGNSGGGPLGCPSPPHRTAASERQRSVADPPRTEQWRQLIQQYPTFGYCGCYCDSRTDSASIGSSSIVC